MLIDKRDSAIKYLACPDSTKFVVDSEDIRERFIKFHGMFSYD